MRDSLDRFPESLDAADEVMITDIYAAGEAPIEGIHGQLLVDQVRARRPDRPVSLTPSHEAIPASLLPRLQAGDVVVTMGAGSITKLSHGLARALTEPR